MFRGSRFLLRTTAHVSLGLFMNIHIQLKISWLWSTMFPNARKIPSARAIYRVNISRVRTMDKEGTSFMSTGWNTEHQINVTLQFSAAFSYRGIFIVSLSCMLGRCQVTIASYFLCRISKQFRLNFSRVMLYSISVQSLLVCPHFPPNDSGSQE